MRLVHLARASSERGIARSGLRGTKWVVDVDGRRTEIERGVFAMPVLVDWSVTFQWLRELRRWHDERMIAVHIRVRDDDEVLVGRYGARHRRVTASTAARRVLDEPAGAEIIVPRSIARSQVLAIRKVPQLVGWTQAPEAVHRNACVCRRCLPVGMPERMRRIRAEYGRLLSVVARSRDAQTRRNAASDLNRPVASSNGRVDPAPLVRLARDSDAKVRLSVVGLFHFFPVRVAQPVLVPLLDDDHVDVRRAAAETLVRRVGPVRAAEIGGGRAEVMSAVLDELEFCEPTKAFVDLLVRIGSDGGGVRVGEVARAWLEDPIAPSLRKTIEALALAC